MVKQEYLSSNLKSVKKISSVKEKDYKKNLNQAIHSTNDPSEIQRNVQQYIKSIGLDYSSNSKHYKKDRKQIDLPEYDMSNLMDKLGDKIPAGIRQMMEQFIRIIPDRTALDSPDLKKAMKKKMKDFGTIFKSPYE